MPGAVKGARVRLTVRNDGQHSVGGASHFHWDDANRTLFRTPLLRSGGEVPRRGTGVV
jgi:urease beta subunit